MAPRLTAVVFQAEDHPTEARFWARLLGRDAVPDPQGGGLLLPGTETQVGLRFVEPDPAAADEDRLHLHLTSSDPGDQQRIVERALRLGASHLDVGQRPEEGHIVLADPAGHALCVIEPHNSYLEGCGFLGEVACDGSRDVGLFWSDALEWPLVWDQDEETAIQSPLGGTKVAWGGPTLRPRTGRAPQQFDLGAAGTDLDAEVERLGQLGATLLRQAEEGVVEMADPDGNEFRVLASPS